MRVKNALKWIKRPGLLPPTLIVLFALFLTFYTSYHTYQNNQMESEVLFDRRSRQVTDSIHNRIQVYVNTLLLSRGLFLIDNEVTREEFRHFLSSIQLNERYPGLQGVGYVKKIEPSQLRTHLRQIRRSGFPDYRVWPEYPRQLYFPIVYIEPFHWRNQRAFGFDMFTESIRHEAMQTAWETGTPTLSGMVKLVQETETDQQPGFLVYVPIYKRNAPTETVEQRKAALQGFVYSPFRAQDLFDQIIKEKKQDQESIVFKIFDGPTALSRSLLYSSSNWTTENDNSFTPRFTKTITIDIANHPWTIELYSLPNFTSSSTQYSHWFILIGGLLISTLIYGFTQYASIQAIKIRESENQLQLVTNSLPVLIAYIDHRLSLLFANKAFEKWYGFSLNESDSYGVREIMGLEAYHQIEPYLLRALKGETVTFEYTMDLPELGSREVQANYIPDRMKNGLIAGIVVLVTDISDQKRNAEQLKEESRALEVTNNVGLSLRAEMDIRKLTQMVTDASSALINAKIGFFFYRSSTHPDAPTKGVYELYCTTGPHIEPLDASTLKAAGRSVFDLFDQEIFLRIDDLNEESKEHRECFRPFSYQIRLRSLLVTPVISRSGEVLGGFVFGHSDANRFQDRAERIIAGLAAQTSVAIDNAHLYQALQNSENNYKDLADSRALLSEASQILMASLDYDRNLKSLAKFIVPRFAEWSCIHILNKDSVEQIAVESIDPEDKNMVWMGPTESLQNGSSDWIPDLSKTSFSELKTFGLSSFISIPMMVRGQIIGVISFGRKNSDFLFTQKDVYLAEEIGRRASTAIDHAKLYEDTQTANRLKDEFLATISHELRTPLNVISGYLELLSEDREWDEEVIRAFDAMQRSAQAQLQIINDLLDVSAITTGKFLHSRKPVNLSEIVQKTIDAVSITAEAKGIHLAIKEQSESCIVLGDDNRLKQILWNLLSNAIKFTDRGGHVDVYLKRSSSKCEIRIQDTGRGIDASFLPFVFDRFRQEDSRTSRSHGGLGLGLSIVKHLVELHGGTVHVESEGKKQGTLFTVRLPILAGMQANEVAPLTQPLGMQIPKPLADSPLKDIKVLVVDDEPDARTVLSIMLDRLGAHVVTAASANEAELRIKEFNPHVMLSDIGMPRRDGYSLIREIRQEETQSSAGFLPAAALTAYIRQEERNRAMDEGFQLYLTKPISSAELIQAVRHLKGLSA